jgi:hypothetical protein
VIISSDISEASSLAWGALGLVSCYDVILIVVLRWHTDRVQITRYEPPAGISPSMAAYLRQSGECERAFAAGIISLAAQGYVRIDASVGQFRVARVRDADNSIPEEESALLLALFPKNDADDCEFGGTDPGRLEQVLGKFQEAVDDLACPDLLSPHTTCWIMGIAYSLAYVPTFAWAALSASHGSLSIGPLLYSCVWVALGAVCLIAALRLWPVTLRKIMSRLPGVTRPRPRFKYGDANPVFLTISALFGFGLLASQTSANFASLIAVIVVISSTSRPLLEVPTRKGREVLSELRDFREFLMRTEADRLSRKDHAQGSPLSFEKFSAYAVALEIGRGMSEDFATQLIQALEFDHAYSFSFLPSRLDTGVAEDHFLQLNLRSGPESVGKSSPKNQ